MSKKKEIDTIHNDASPDGLFLDISSTIDKGKREASRLTNEGIVMMFWEVGKRINEEILKNERAEYGKQITVTVSQQLQIKYGKSFAYSNLTRMMKFAREFSNLKIIAPLAQQLSWSQISEILPLKSMNEKLYYANEVAKGNLGVRDLRHLISRKAYERRDIPNLKFPNQSKVPFNVFKDPYLLDILDLKDNFLEADLEKTILTKLKNYILEFGQGFSFVARQKRITFEGEDYYIDLLFYNRELRRLVAIDLRLGKFKAEYKGQMEACLRLLNLLERKEGEEQPIGIILCTEANKGMLELLEMDKVGIMVSEYWTKLPPKDQLEQKIKEIIFESKERVERSKSLSEQNNIKQVKCFIEPKQNDCPDED